MEEQNLFLPVTARRGIRQGIQVMEGSREEGAEIWKIARKNRYADSTRKPNDGTQQRSLGYATAAAGLRGGQGDEDERYAWNGRPRRKKLVVAERNIHTTERVCLEKSLVHCARGKIGLRRGS